MGDGDKTQKQSSQDVGYSKPPVHSRFKKGRSGNPNGRPKGTVNIATIMAKTLREQVVINENGQRKTITKLEAAAKQLVNKAASGDLTAMRQLMSVVVMVEQQSKQDSASACTSFDDADQKVIVNLLSRLNTEGDGKP